MKNEMKTKVMIAGAAFCAALFLFSGFMLCREYLDQKQSAEAFEEVAELVKRSRICLFWSWKAGRSRCRRK